MIYGPKPLPLTEHLSSQGRICWGASIPEMTHIHFLPGTNDRGIQEMPLNYKRMEGPSSKNLFPSLSLAINHPPRTVHRRKPQMCGEHQVDRGLGRDGCSRSSPWPPPLPTGFSLTFHDCNLCSRKWISPKDFFFFCNHLPASSFPSPTK